jgi:hypothetical protein
VLLGFAGGVDAVVTDVSVGTFVSLSSPSAPPQAVSATINITAPTLARAVFGFGAVVAV